MSAAIPITVPERVRAYAEVASRCCGGTPEGVLGRSRLKRDCEARMWVIGALADDGFTTGQIARWMQRDTATVHYALASFGAR